MHKCASPLVQEHICSPHLRLHFPLSLYLGSQAPSALWFSYLFRDLPDHCGSWALWNKMGFIRVWFREEADYYQSMSLSHVSLPSRTCSCRSMWFCFKEPQIRAIIDITLSFHHFLAGDLSSSTDWANTPTRILVLLREHGWGDSKSRIIVFPQQHLTPKGEITWSHPLSSGMTESLSHLLDSLSADRLTTSCGLRISFCGGLVYLLGK